MEEAGDDVWRPGDLNSMFEKLVREPYLSKYDVQILSSPEMDGPWVITMENVVSPKEAERFIELGTRKGYRRSLGVGEVKYDGTVEDVESNVRTSSNAWCQDECYEDATAQAVTERIVDMIGIPEGNAEFIQLLRYEVGQL